MTNPDNCARRWLFSGVAMLIVALLAVACGSQAPSQPAATATTATQPAATTGAATEAPTAGATQPAKPAVDVPVGVDEQGNFYRGDVNAPVKIEDFSDFQ